MKYRMFEKSSAAGCDLKKSRRLMIQVVVQEMKTKCKGRHWLDRTILGLGLSLVHLIQKTERAELVQTVHD